MISRRLFWALIASIVIHFAIAAFAIARHPFMHAGAPEEVVSVTTTLSIRHRPAPSRIAVAKPRTKPPLPQRKPEPKPRSLPQPAPPHRELARLNRKAPASEPQLAYVHARSPVVTAQQPVNFEKTIEQLRQMNNPVVQAERPVQPADTSKRYAFDFSGSVGGAPRGEGILTPERSWQADGYNYYYVRYWVQYPDGTTETGIVPWPLRYLPSDDPFRLHALHFPLPAPLADYTLPAGTSLHPLVAYCYEHRDELDSCPIHHE